MWKKFQIQSVSKNININIKHINNNNKVNEKKTLKSNEGIKIEEHNGIFL